MNTTLAEALVAVAGIYSGIGLLFALAFVSVGAGRIDPGVATGSIGFRILIIPGSAALWPLLAWRWRGARAARDGVDA